MVEKRKMRKKRQRSGEKEQRVNLGRKLEFYRNKADRVQRQDTCIRP